MKIALGMIISSLDCEKQLMSFIENAEKYGHKLDCVILAHTHKNNPKAEQKIRNKVTLFTISNSNPSYCKEQMQIRGISENTAKTLLECPVDSSCGLVPYGFNRTLVVTEAILRGIDILFFVDSDVYPKVLAKTQNGHMLKEIDFFTGHLKHLSSDADITTGEYSGYNILPPAKFDAMEAFLDGVQKPEMLEYWQTSETHRSLTVEADEAVESDEADNADKAVNAVNADEADKLKQKPKPCSKVLGGNLAIRLSSFAKLSPFFSSYYTYNDERFLCRGEDTMLGVGIAQNNVKCVDIGLRPLHDTYKNYPSEPNLQTDKMVQERFYYACTGWVGRNPLYNHILKNDIQSTREHQRVCLEKGLQALASYTSNPKFNEVLRNFDASWNSLTRYISELEQICEAWQNFTDRVL